MILTSANNIDLEKKLIRLEAQLKAINDENIKQRRTLEDTLYNLDGDNIPSLTTIIKSISDNGAALASFKAEVSDTYATAEQLSQYQSDAATATAAVKTYADSTFATTTSLAQYQSGTNTTLAQIQQTASADEAKISLVVSTSSGQNTVNSAGIVAAINAAGSTVRINADKIINTGTTMFLTAGDVGAGGQTVIDGGRITTGEVSSDRFKRVANSSYIDMASNTRINGILGIINNNYPNSITQMSVEGSGVFRIQSPGDIYLYPDYTGSAASTDVYIAGYKVITTGDIKYA